MSLPECWICCLFRDAICHDNGQHFSFDAMFQSYFSGDEDGSVHQVFDAVIDSGQMPVSAMSMVYGYMFDTSGAEQDEDLLYALAASLLAENVHGDVMKRQRLNWWPYMHHLKREGTFTNMYQMSNSLFNTLLGLLSKDSKLNEVESWNRTSGVDPVGPELALHCTLRYLAGGSYHNIRITAGILKPAFYSCVLKCLKLQLHMPTSSSELLCASLDFTELSSHGILNGCVGCLMAGSVKSKFSVLKIHPT